MVLDVLFWVVFVLAVAGAFYDAPAPYHRAPWLLLLIDIGILGLKVVAFK